MEGVYSTLYQGELHESRDEGQGERFLVGAPGVYVHKQATAQKSENYLRFTPLCEDGAYWAVKWELLVDRKKQVKVPRKTDQWVQRVCGTRLRRLWVCGRTLHTMQENIPFQERWDPMMEANPHDQRWARMAMEEVQANATEDNDVAVAQERRWQVWGVRCS